MTRLFLYSLLFTVCSWNIFVQSVPYMMMHSSRPKCLGVIASQDQTVTIRYEVPDLVITDDDNKSENGLNDLLVDPKPNPEVETRSEQDERLNDQWNRRMKEKLQRIKDKKMRDTSITVTQKGGIGSPTLMSRQRRTSRQQLTGSGRIREELVKNSGVIEFLTGDMDGTVDICIQSISAKPNNPVRFSFDISITQTDEEKAKAEAPPSAEEKLENKQVKQQMTRLERDLQTLNNRVQTILSNADFNKDQEVAFHQQSIAMNRASTFWPIIQLLVLIVTGVTQANHIVKFMKSRHIG